jgi:hypothetical protein
MSLLIIITAAAATTTKADMLSEVPHIDFRSLSGLMPGYYLKLCYYHFLLYPFQF